MKQFQSATASAQTLGKFDRPKKGCFFFFFFFLFLGLLTEQCNTFIFLFSIAEAAKEAEVCERGIEVQNKASKNI